MNVKYTPRLHMTTRRSYRPRYRHWLAVAALAITGVACLSPVRAETPANPELTKLRTDAIHDFAVGRFDAGSDLLAQAAKVSGDNDTARMLKWSDQFRDQLKVFSGERHTAYDKAVADSKLMVTTDHADYALDFADRAETLSDDKKTFPQLPWVRTLIDDAVTRAADYEKKADWYRAMRLYRDLAAVEPSSKEWKEKLKETIRRVRLVATYAPDVYKTTLDKETAERDAVEKLVNPPKVVATTEPMAEATKTESPTTKPSEAEENDAFKIDWHDTLKGIEMPMLASALSDANAEYYRDIDYKTLVTGGLVGIEAVVNTKGMEKTFPNLADDAKRAEFQTAIDRWRDQIDNATADTMEGVCNTILGDGPDGMLAVNARTLQLPDAVLISEFADGAFANLDPFTAMIWPSEVAEFRKMTQGQFSGIGIQIEEDNGDLKVVRPLSNSPAQKAGIKSGDVIAKINGKSAHGITSDQAVKGITGPAGTVVNITIRTPDGTLEEMNIRRAQIHVESVEGYSRDHNDDWNFYVDPDNKIAYIRITSFSGTTREELGKVLKYLDANGVNGVIVDLRGNPGGLLTAATGVCDQFLDKGVIVSTHPDRDTRNAHTMATAEDDHIKLDRRGMDLPVCDKPLVVLVNQYSASASEIVSGCLKDDHRAILVGERTFGKGSVQQIFPPDATVVEWKITTAHYYLPSGRCIHREENSTEWGVDPDVVVDMTPEQMRAAAIARNDMEMARAVNAAPAEGLQPKLNDIAKPGPANGQPVKPEGATTQPSGAPATQPAVHKTLLEADPQLSAALLVLRLEVVGKTQ